MTGRLVRRLGGGGREGRGYDISLGAEFDWQTGVQRGGEGGAWRGEGAEFDRQPIGQL